jgi:hypothetical protein
MMRKNINLFAILFLLFISCGRDTKITDPEIRDPTTLQGKLSGILSLLDSPYIITENITVDSSDELSIENGVQLFFKRGTFFSVYGKLAAYGQRDLPIMFKSASVDSAWRGIHIVNSPGISHFNFCVLEGVRIEWNDSLNFGALSFTKSNGIIENCIFRDNYAQNGGAIAASNSSISIKNSLFLNNESVVFGGAVFAMKCSTIFINNTIYDNLSTNIGGGLVLFNGIYGNVQNNIFYQNWGQSGDPRIYLEQTDSALVQFGFNFLRGDSLNPSFVRTEKPNQNFHLNLGSTCIDAGNPDPQFNDPDGSRNDQGAYGGVGGNW